MTGVLKVRAAFGVERKDVPGVLARASAMYTGMDNDPATYARIFAALMPKQVEITDEDPISNLTDEQLEAYCAELERQIAERATARPTPTLASAAPGSQRVN